MWKDAWEALGRYEARGDLEREGQNCKCPGQGEVPVFRELRPRPESLF